MAALAIRGREMMGLGCPDCGGRCGQRGLGDDDIAALCNASNPASPLNSPDANVAARALNDCNTLGLSFTITAPSNASGSTSGGGGGSVGTSSPLPLAIPGGASFSPGAPGTTSGIGLGLINLPSIPEGALPWWEWLLLFGLLGVAVYAGVKLLRKEL